MADGLILRDVHRPPAPSLWPLAPGWWMVLAAVIILVAAVVWFHRARARRREIALALFDAELADASSPTTRLARSSELLRRASRRVRADADRLEGDDWLRLLETPKLRFVDGPGRLLLDGAFRPSVDARSADAAVDLARARFVELMGRRA
ncbi:DUF4381 domain-containing protein [Lysobacter sp. TY2-98]|uniref:DUF4381 domain-containing protein n=1 Tax=Lysobacter sp. TY2-98 TaxID=2290922 RepID=UPI000E2032F7|nr:DUF4381 domain-containing protein [Lysobacter sp. TY2-98]AXK71142.1 DUF4381 domain-containing protein [Lysobacter sp. TY2-98]